MSLSLQCSQNNSYFGLNSSYSAYKMQESTEVNTELIGNTNTISSTSVPVTNNNNNNTIDIAAQIQLILANYHLREDPEIVNHKPITLNILPKPVKENTRVDKNLDCKGVRSRAWFMTINNFTDQDVSQIKAEDSVYKVWQFEVGKSGTKHLHCLLYFKNPRTWPKKRYPTARIEFPRSLDACIVYCQKEKTRVEGPWEVGTRPCQGRRSDLEELASSIRTGTTLREIANTNGSEFIRYHRGLQALREVYMKPRDRKKKAQVIWIYGPSGVGKTQGIFESFDNDEDIYIKANNKWWDGYQQQKVILWDEIDVRGCPVIDFLTIFDRYPCQRETKGGHVHINSKYMFVTSSCSPTEMYGENENRIVEILRRIDMVVKLEADGKFSVEKNNGYEWVD